MKSLKVIVPLVFFCVTIFTVGSCVVLKTREVPPGHEKKIEGDRSAREHAPGQEKK